MNRQQMKSTFSKTISNFFEEDDLTRNIFYQKSLPKDKVSCQLKIKSDLILAGLPWFEAAFQYLDEQFKLSHEVMAFEGSELKKGDELNFDLPFNIALNGERIALNLLSHGSAIASFTNLFVKKAEGSGIKILDTRKTTPGLRSLEKYSVRCGGGYNHRLGQTDLWMVKDNHKKFFGGVEQAVNFFNSVGSFYNEIEVEIHDLKELEKALEMGINHLMLDNFSPADIKKAVSLKKEKVTYEVSGGITLDTIDNYLLPGVDAISVGRITYGAPPVDISLKYERV
ncbi:MAG: nicotinate-nucleotide pyrophosphorylase (carboxylating) [Bacteriovoracaceae bacterium]|jgi:nicotinate-nucleotide pyrophosphorylase (carboxylating)